MPFLLFYSTPFLVSANFCPTLGTKEKVSRTEIVSLGIFTDGTKEETTTKNKVTVSVIKDINLTNEKLPLSS